MNSKLLYILIIVVSILSFTIYIFFKKDHLNFELISKVSKTNEEFRPFAYRFFHSQNDYDNFLNINSNTIKLKSDLPKAKDLDFENYSYCIFFGKGLSDLYYSYKTTYYDDPSPSYASCARYGKKYVVVIYKNLTSNKDNGIFLYKVKRDVKLRGVDGL